MTLNPPNPRNMPDVAKTEAHAIQETLDWVGMSGIHLPTYIKDMEGNIQAISAYVQAYVSLDDPEAKGIHMSRLFLGVETELSSQGVSPDSLRQLLDGFLASHENLSENAFIEVSFDYSLKRNALKSDHAGWKGYPVVIRASKQRGQSTEIELKVDIPYSSTCPCSAALSRQLIQEQFSKDFDSGTVDVEAVKAWLGSTNGVVATPHSQRSIAEIKVKLSDSDQLDVVTLIDLIESTLKTPVQTAVKREDEQEFARLNGQNLMFCEDAARKIKAALLSQSAAYVDFWVRVNHLESLHAHDAVAIVVAGRENGYLPIP